MFTSYPSIILLVFGLFIQTLRSVSSINFNARLIKGTLVTSGDIMDELEKAYMQRDPNSGTPPSGLVDAIQDINRCDTANHVFLTLQKDEDVKRKWDSGFRNHVVNALASALAKCVKTESWKWGGMKDILNWAEKLYVSDEVGNDGAVKILNALEFIDYCGTVAGVFTNVQWPAPTLKWDGNFRSIVLRKLALSAPRCIKTYGYWTVADFTAVLDWVFTNQDDIGESILQAFRQVKLHPSKVFDAFIGILNKKYPARSVWDDGFRAGALIALAPAFVSVSVDETISFTDFMRVLVWAKENPGKDSTAVVKAISPRLKSRAYSVPDLVAVLEWVRKNNASFTRIIMQSLHDIRDCARSLELILAAYSKEYPESRDWDVDFQNSVLDVVISAGLDCVKAGTYKNSEILQWLGTARRNEGFGAFELSDEFKNLGECDQAVELFFDLFLDVDLITDTETGDLPQVDLSSRDLRDSVANNIGYAVTNCMAKRKYAGSQMNQLIEWMMARDPHKGEAIWKALIEIDDCSKIQAVHDAVKFDGDVHGDLLRSISASFPKCFTNK